MGYSFLPAIFSKLSACRNIQLVRAGLYSGNTRSRKDTRDTKMSEKKEDVTFQERGEMFRENFADWTNMFALPQRTKKILSLIHVGIGGQELCVQMNKY